MTKNQKIILGIASIIPLLLGFFYLISIINYAMSIFDIANSDIENGPQGLFAAFQSMMILAILMFVANIALIIYYIIHITNNETMDSNTRTMWIVIIIFVNIVSFPIYWYMQIWKTPQAIEDDAIIN